MKISLEFDDLRDLLFQLPKLGTLLGDDLPYTERIKAALEPDPKVLQISVTPKDCVPFTFNEKEALRRLLLEFVRAPEDFVKDPDAVANKVVAGLKTDNIIPEKAPRAEAQAEAPAPAAEPAEAPATTAPKENTSKKAAQKPTEAPDKAEKPETSLDTPEPENATQTATEPSDADVRAALSNLLKQDRRAAVKKVLKSFGASNFSGLAKENYAAAIEAARSYLTMNDNEYEEAVKK